MLVRPSNLHSPITRLQVLVCHEGSSSAWVRLHASIASLVGAPAARPDARCLHPQCRVTNELLTKSYDTAARIGHLGNSLSHLVLALFQSLHDVNPDERKMSSVACPVPTV